MWRCTKRSHLSYEDNVFKGLLKNVFFVGVHFHSGLIVNRLNVEGLRRKRSRIAGVLCFSRDLLTPIADQFRSFGN